MGDTRGLGEMIMGLPPLPPLPVITVELGEPLAVFIDKLLAHGRPYMVSSKFECKPDEIYEIYQAEYHKFMIIREVSETEYLLHYPLEPEERGHKLRFYEVRWGNHRFSSEHLGRPCKCNG